MGGTYPLLYTRKLPPRTKTKGNCKSTVFYGCLNFSEIHPNSVKERPKNFLLEIFWSEICIINMVTSPVFQPKGSLLDWEMADV